MSHRILFVASHRPGRAPSQRFRFEQYLDALSAAGFECELSSLVTPWHDRRIYKSGHVAAKAHFALRSQFIRGRDLARAADYDVVFVHREALMMRGNWFERGVGKRQTKLVFDFDDAIWMHGDSGVSAANRRFRWLKDPDKIAGAIGASDLVLAGNEFLADYARRFTSSVEIVPTTIDTEFFKTARDRTAPASDSPLCIGWSGSPTTIPHFETATEALTRIRTRYGDRVRFKVIGDGNYRNEALRVSGIPWSLETEVAGVDEIDIGIMPLPDDEWVNGKCGFKALMYMSFEIPTIVSPLGVNPQIVEHGINGLHASTVDEWVDELSRLIEDAELRRRLGVAGRKTIVERYSVAAHRGRYVTLMRSLVE